MLEGDCLHQSHASKCGLMGSSQTSSLMSARMITWSLLLLHAWLRALSLRLARILCHGHTIHPCANNHCRCCWYIERCPSNLHGHWSTTICRKWFYLPQQELHPQHPSPNWSLPGVVVLCNSTFILEGHCLVVGIHCQICLIYCVLSNGLLPTNPASWRVLISWLWEEIPGCIQFG